MQYLKDTHILCLEYSELVPDIMPIGTYKSGQYRESLKIHGTGGNGRSVLIEYEALSPMYKAKVIAKFGDPYKYQASQVLLRLVREDLQARSFYASYRLPDGRPLPIAPTNYQQIYSRQADWLNMIINVLNDKSTLKEELNISVAAFYENVMKLYANDRIENKLPDTLRRLMDKLTTYKKEGYSGLVAKRWMNQNSRKVTASIERLIMSLYCMPDKPYFKKVCEYYEQFMEGKLQVLDLETGEVFSPKDFMVKGKPYIVKEATVKYYIDDKPLSRAIVDKVRMSALEYATKHQPHMIRTAPIYAFSKVTMDDTSSPFNMHDGNRPATYKAFDVASGAMIALVMHKRPRPDVPLIRRMMADMLSLIVRRGWNMPHEVEVENALMSEMKGKKQTDGSVQNDVLTSGVVFPFVRFCAPRNPQEKRAEGFIKQLKHQYQRHRAGFQLRPFAKLEANRKNEDAKHTKLTFTFEEVYRMECEDQQKWNNALHPNQDRYPGLTRWQVLEQHQNPELKQLDISQVLPYIGNRTETSIDRQYVQVQGRKYMLSDLSKATGVSLSDNKVVAYYLKDETGSIHYVHLYEEDGEPICSAVPVGAYQEAKAEQTDDDLHTMGRQRNYRDKFDKMVEEGVAKLVQVAVLPTETHTELQEEARLASEIPTESSTEQPKNEQEQGGYQPKNEGETPWYMNNEQVESRAIKGI